LFNERELIIATHNPGKLREIAQLLEPQLMVDDRIRLIQRQLWTYFERENPGPGALLPGMDEEIA